MLTACMVLPITSGYRLALVYNLRRQGRGQLPEPPNYDTEQTRVAALLRRWSVAKDAPDGLPQAALSLEHAYTPAELAFEALKGADAAVADVLVAAASAADCDLHLALVSITESGSAEHIGYYGSRRRRWSDEEDEEDFEVSEVHDRQRDVIGLAASRRQPAELGALPFMEDELCPPDAFEDLEPDEQYFHEATGNEGASFERTYRRAALVLWPRARLSPSSTRRALAVLCYLGELTGAGLKVAKVRIALWREAHELSGHMLRVAKAGRLVSREDRDAQRRRHAADPAESAAGCGTYRHFLDILAAGA